MLSARNLQELTRVQQACEKSGMQAAVTVADVSREQDCKHLVEETIARFGRLDVLVNNAGISMRALFSECDLDVLRRLMDVNFWGTVYCTKYAMPHLLKAKGSVIGVSSVAGIKGLPARTGYSASKSAMNGFMEALRIENLDKGLHVGVICPGYTASNIRNTALGKDGRSQQETPLDESELMSPSVVGDAILRMVEQRRAELVLTAQGKLTAFLNKFFPRWMDRQVLKVVSREKDSPV
jgi:short-subunit dehydrogenase